MKTYFDHERLKVYQLSLGFNEWVGEGLVKVVAKAAAKDQLDRAATSIPLNIAEGNGKFSKRDRARFFDISRGSALEAAAALDALVSRKCTTADAIAEAKEQLVQIVNMLMGLLKSLGYVFATFGSRVGEDEPEFRITSKSRRKSRKHGG